MDLSLIIPFLLIVMLIPMFLSGRKQRRQMAQTQEMQRGLDTGDVVTTTSGLRGTIVDASYEDTVDLEIADGVVTTWLRAAIREKIEEPASAEPAALEEEPAAAADEPVAVDLEKAEKDDSRGGTPRS